MEKTKARRMEKRLFTVGFTVYIIKCLLRFFDLLFYYTCIKSFMISLSVFQRKFQRNFQRKLQL